MGKLEQEKYHILYVTPPHEPDHWRPTINADVHRRGVPGTQNSQGKGGGGGRNLGSVRVLLSKCCCLVPSSATMIKKALIYTSMKLCERRLSPYKRVRRSPLIHCAQLQHRTCN